MKKWIAGMLVVTVMCTTGCDLMRKLAGRPTSDEIAAKRTEILRRQALQKQQADSAAQAQKAAADTAKPVAVPQAPKEKAEPVPAGNTAAKASSVVMQPSSSVKKEGLDHKYYVIVGSFKEKANAEQFLSKFEEKGHHGAVVPLKGGLTAVAAAYADTREDALAVFERVRTEKFCPSDAWVLINE